MISLHKTKLTKNDLNHAILAMKSNWISTGGKYIEKFENEFKKKTNLKNVIALSTGTNALQIAVNLCGANKDTEVILPTVSFVATANAVLYNNAHPVFMDVNSDLNIDVNKTYEFFNKNTFKKGKYIFNKKTKRKIVAIIVVHVFGKIVPKIFELKKFCVKNNIKLIEDAAEAVGSKIVIGKKNLHAGLFGDFACFSFNANKTITAGTGGILVCKKNLTHNKAKFICSTAKNNVFKFVHNELGYNFKMTNINAAIGYSQLKSLNVIKKKKKNIYKFYENFFKKEKTIKLLEKNKSNSNYWMNAIKIKSKKNLDKKFENFMTRNKIQIRSVWLALHKQKYLLNFEKYKITKANDLLRNFYCIPSGPGLKKKELQKVCDKVMIFVKKYHNQ